MRRSLHILSLFFAIVWSMMSFAQGNIIITFKPIRHEESPETMQSIVDKKPEKIPNLIMKHKLKPESGIIARINGYTNISDINGHMMFPRDAIEDTLNILITTHIKPVIYHGNTVHHWLISKPENTILYKATRTKDSQTEIHTWNIEPSNLPDTMIVPRDTLVIFARPSDILVPTGDYVTRGDPNLIVPHFFVKQGSSAPEVYVQYLKHSRLYRHLKKVYKDAQTTTSYLITG